MQTEPRERALEHVEDFLYDLQDKTGLERHAHIAENYPHLTRAFINRYMDLLVAMTPEQLVSVIGYPDPVGETAARNVDLERTS